MHLVVGTVIGIAVLIAVGLVIRAITNAVRPKDFQDTRGRARCGKCQKILYRNGRSAEAAAENARTRGTYLRAYYDRRCGYWHLTSQLPRTRRF